MYRVFPRTCSNTPLVCERHRKSEPLSGGVAVDSVMVSLEAPGLYTCICKCGLHLELLQAQT